MSNIKATQAAADSAAPSSLATAAAPAPLAGGVVAARAAASLTHRLRVLIWDATRQVGGWAWSDADIAHELNSSEHAVRAAIGQLIFRREIVSRRGVTLSPDPTVDPANAGRTRRHLNRVLVYTGRA